jgi:ABC-type lipoprotein release transport system permease subunit
MFMLIFVVGVLLGTLFGGTLCVHYLRREISADIGPQLRQINIKIETLESVLNLALVTRYAELAAAPATRAANGQN